MPEPSSYSSLKTAELLARTKRLLKETANLELKIKQLREELSPRMIRASKPPQTAL